MANILNPDLVVCKHNFTVGVKPTGSGRLTALVKLTAHRAERVWVFKDTTVHLTRGDEVIDHKVRGLVVGNINDYERFFSMCKSFGLTIQSQGFRVPLANGMIAVGSSDARFSYKDIQDFSREEIVRCRWDLPTREDLENILASPK